VGYAEGEGGGGGGESVGGHYRQMVRDGGGDGDGGRGEGRESARRLGQRLEASVKQHGRGLGFKLEGLGFRV